ncbi:hypothetical protein ACFV2N_45225 [Streptomyces sp. NPDC059680]|uniref:hypothetical protein n=1 Tax=Streptomyces sp. NPDC059680 TaxID=3346904 RepID=UPI0036813838
MDVFNGQARQPDGVVALGDSITNHPYPDKLAERLARSGHPRPVLNRVFGLTT